MIAVVPWSAIELPNSPFPVASLAVSCLSWSQSRGSPGSRRKTVTRSALDGAADGDRALARHHVAAGEEPREAGQGVEGAGVAGHQGIGDVAAGAVPHQVHVAGLEAALHLLQGLTFQFLETLKCGMVR